MDKIRTRFAPSPTGMMHVGSLRTALYNFLFARKNNGQFIFRLEDTDRERYVPEAVTDLTDNLQWLGLDFDEGPVKGGTFTPYVQSERLEIYKKHADELLDKGLAYKDERAIRFKVAKEGKTSWVDLIGNKEISFDNNTQEDFIILKSDGFPTYNFANVIDDHYMEINHVLRGPEFIPSTPKHLMIYQALGWIPPQFAHLSMILGTDRSKLSKRHGAKGVTEFRKEGYLSDALLNFMALLGWAPSGDKEIMSLEEMIEGFDIKNIHSSPAVFDITKLDWMNGEYIRKSQKSKIKDQIYQYIRDLSEGSLSEKDHPTEEEIEKVVPLIQDRIKKLSDFIPLTDFLWEKPEYEIEVFKKIPLDNQKEVLDKIAGKMESLRKPWDSKTFEETFRKLADELRIKPGNMFQLIRVAVSGQLVTPPLFESMMILGEDESLNRVKFTAQKYPSF